ncbi:unnamed protein product, partial [Meganyctiphanes norvegica]
MTLFRQTSLQNLNCSGEPDTLEPHQRDNVKERYVLIWIYNMVQEASLLDYELFLKDGTILCKLMNRISPGSIQEDLVSWYGTTQEEHQKNTLLFLKEAETYGIPKEHLFFLEDLNHLRHIPRVTRCIYALAKLAADDPANNCPIIEDSTYMVDNKSERLPIPGHLDTVKIERQLSQEDSQLSNKEEKKFKHSLYH